MFTSLLAILFIIKLKLSRSRNLPNYIRQKYDGNTLRIYRHLESSIKKWKKAELDHDFLLYCKMSNIVPNFIKFKLYRSSLYNSDFYKSATQSLLDIEINFKTKSITKLKSSVLSLSDSLYDELSLFDRLYVKTVLNRTVKTYTFNVTQVHKRKLLKLGISQPKFISPRDIVKNYILSNYILSQQEEFLLSLGLDFCLPNFKPNYCQFFLPFERFFHHIRSLPAHINLEKAQQSIQNIAYKVFSSLKGPNWFPFFNRDDFLLLKKLSKNKAIIICRPDKGRGVVILNRHDYVQKMENILSDSSKFVEVGDPQYNLIFKAEDKINRTIKQLKDKGMLSEQEYQSLYSSGSSFGVLYGLPKVHKSNLPLRPILAAYNSPNYPLAKFLVPLLSHLTNNQFTLQNSAKFIPEILEQNSNSYMVSYDVESLFTNVPLGETIDIILNKLFPTQNTLFHGFDVESFRKLLELSVNDTHFVFNNRLYKQVDGMSMGSPLGPCFANIFMCQLEESFLSQCPESFRPIFYKRYVDDTFLLFNDKAHANMFLNYINTFHQNIKFSMEVETNNNLSFLDINISRSNGNFLTSIFRKKTHTGLGLIFFSNCSFSFKINSIQTLLSRAYSLCSNWSSFHEEISLLQVYFKNNCYPSHIVDRIFNRFLNNVFQPRVNIPDVPKKLMYISLPYVKNAAFRHELEKILSPLYPYVNFKFVFKNPLTIGSLFSFKDTLPELMRSFVVYEYKCPKCNFGNYVGSTRRLLKVRIDSHRGVSHRTGCILKSKEFSSVRNHANSCKTDIHYNNFKILSQTADCFSLLLLESLYIKKLSPSLNNQTAATPLHIA